MPKVALSKSALQKERVNLKLYERVLPSLDLKRLQLMGELARARNRMAADRAEEERTASLVADRLPMMADTEVDLDGLVKVTAIHVSEENTVGVKLPRLEKVDMAVTPYSLMSTPPWVDMVVTELEKMLHLKATAKISERRVEILEHAVRRVTQRINLFEKILIPRAKENIRRIKLFLADVERASIVRSKLAKAKRLKEKSMLRASEETP